MAVMCAGLGAIVAGEAGRGDGRGDERRARRRGDRRGSTARTHGDARTWPRSPAEPDVRRLRRGGRGPMIPLATVVQQVTDRDALEGVGVGAIGVAGAAVRRALGDRPRRSPPSPSSAWTLSSHWRRPCSRWTHRARRGPAVVDRALAPAVDGVHEGGRVADPAGPVLVGVVAERASRRVVALADVGGGADAELAWQPLHFPLSTMARRGAPAAFQTFWMATAPLCRCQVLPLL